MSKYLREGIRTNILKFQIPTCTTSGTVAGYCPKFSFPPIFQYLKLPLDGARRLQTFTFLTYNALKWERSLYSWTLKKIPIILKNASIKNRMELNFLQETQWMHISVYLWSGAGSSKNFLSFQCIIIFQEHKSLEPIVSDLGILGGPKLAAVFLNSANGSTQGDHFDGPSQSSNSWKIILPEMY